MTCRIGRSEGELYNPPRHVGEKDPFVRDQANARHDDVSRMRFTLIFSVLFDFPLSHTQKRENMDEFSWPEIPWKNLENFWKMVENILWKNKIR